MNHDLKAALEEFEGVFREILAPLGLKLEDIGINLVQRAGSEDGDTFGAVTFTAYLTIDALRNDDERALDETFKSLLSESGVFAEEFDTDNLEDF